jgi:hypothetical protein
VAMVKLLVMLLVVLVLLTVLLTVTLEVTLVAFEMVVTLVAFEMVVTLVVVLVMLVVALVVALVALITVVVLVIVTLTMLELVLLDEPLNVELMTGRVVTLDVVLVWLAADPLPLGTVVLEMVALVELVMLTTGMITVVLAGVSSAWSSLSSCSANLVIQATISSKPAGILMPTETLRDVETFKADPLTQAEDV